MLVLLLNGGSRRLLVPRSSFRLLLGEKRVGLLRWQLCVLDVRFRSAVLSSRKLAPVHLIVLFLQLAHLLNFIEVYDEARFKIVQIFDAFATKY